MPNIGTLTAGIKLDIGDFRKRTAEAKQALGQTGQAAGKASQSIGSIEKSAAQSGGSLKRLSDSAGKIGTALAALSAPLAGFAAVGVKVFADFEKNMAQVQGITGATGEEFEALTSIAQEMGRTTVFTAGQSAEALRFLGMAGLSASDSIEALPHVLNLAAAGALSWAVPPTLFPTLWSRSGSRRRKPGASPTCWQRQPRLPIPPSSRWALRWPTPPRWPIPRACHSRRRRPLLR